MRKISSSELDRLVVIGKKAISVIAWGGDIPGKEGFHQEKGVLAIDGILIESTVELFKRHISGMGMQWREHKIAVVIGGSHWIAIDNLSGVKSFSPVVNGKPDQGVDWCEREDWIMSPEDLALQRP